MNSDELYKTILSIVNGMLLASESGMDISKDARGLLDYVLMYGNKCKTEAELLSNDNENPR